MFPRVPVEIDISIPAADTYWVPKPNEIGDEGFGAFLGVWPIVKATTSTTADVIEDERVAAEYVDSRAANTAYLSPDSPLPSTWFQFVSRANA
jgi:hypothetical protein